MLRLVVALVLACSYACVPECEPGEAKACYEALASTKGVGACKAGTQACSSSGAWGSCAGQVLPKAETCNTVDDDCDGAVDESGANACGGCARLAGTLGAACTTQLDCPGHLACKGTEALTCSSPADRNACGVCGPPVAGVGTACVADGCPGVIACDAIGTGVTCSAAPRNNCGVCGAANVPGLGYTCTNASGCSGFRVCDAAGTGMRCDAPTRNACGVCGPAVPDPSGACTVGSCTGRLDCNAAGDAVVCVAPGINACGVCGGAPVAGVGAACVGDNGCAGTLQCTASRDSTRCVAPAKNECGVCGGPAIPVGNGCDGGPAAPACLIDATGVTIASVARSALTVTATNLGCTGTAGGRTLSCTGVTTITKSRCRDGFAYTLVRGNATLQLRLKGGTAWTAGALINGLRPADGSVSIAGLSTPAEPVPKPGAASAAQFFFRVDAANVDGGLVETW